MLGTLGSYLGSIGTFIQNHKGPIEKDRKLLVPAGQAIMGGLISSISSEKDALAAELADMTSLLNVGPDDATLGITAQADAISRNLSVDSSRQLQIGWKNGASADPVLRAFQDLISLEFGGDVNAAFAPNG
ncbi:hypothetical protein [Paractinoplanes durhamensis]|uniref:Uncharacterized protein n=1 Tax=Paractinoplanes durhamensis TaxID=113563 RepID=A0ABQ3ZE72_9ACTN|nr:hypothetical protein [Actinoplanes durhamensis]GIE08101.1 hypothetical protein Adu01nite_94510 [Actinoplanes durhamensis]